MLYSARTSARPAVTPAMEVYDSRLLITAPDSAPAELLASAAEDDCASLESPAAVFEASELSESLELSEPPAEDEAVEEAELPLMLEDWALVLEA